MANVAVSSSREESYKSDSIVSPSSRRRTVDSDGMYSRVVLNQDEVLSQEDKVDASGHSHGSSSDHTGFSTRGHEASKRRALLDLLFFCCAGDVKRCQQIVRQWDIDVKDWRSCDYDRRYPLHLAASEGCYRVVEWLVKGGADVNVIDRFNHTPLGDALAGDHAEVAKLLMAAGAMVTANGQLVSLDEAGYSSYVEMFKGNFDAEVEWEMDRNAIILGPVIGKGEFGTVYRATWHDSVVAVKVLNDDSDVAKGELRSELATMRKTHHPHTVQCLGAVTSSEPYMIVTEYMPMGSVADIFDKNINLGIRRSAELALHMARGMAYLHARRPSCIIHRDLKPANIMIGSSPYAMSKNKDLILKSLGVAKIADFGLCKTISLDNRLHKAVIMEKNMTEDEMIYLQDSRHAPSYKMTGETGSYRYMAPEVFRHEPYNRKVDVYSFAMIFYYLLSGIPPLFESNAVKAAQLAALHGIRPSWPAKNRWNDAVPENLRCLVERCWDPSPDKRPDFSEICVELSAIIKSIPESATSTSGCSCCMQ